MDFFSKISDHTNKKILFLCLFIMITGLSSGIFFTSMIPASDRGALSGFLQEAIASHDLSIPSVIIYNLLLLALIFFCGLSVYGFPLAALLFFCRSMLPGICIPLVTSAPAADFLPFLLFNMILLLVYLAATAACISYGSSRIHIRT